MDKNNKPDSIRLLDTKEDALRICHLEDRSLGYIVRQALREYTQRYFAAMNAPYQQRMKIEKK
jgi:hypothetical protein